MKVREMMAELLEKDPDDELEMEVKVSLHANNHCIKKSSAFGAYDRGSQR